MEPSVIVAEELDKGLPFWKDLPDDLQKVVESHCVSLTKLVKCMDETGRDREDIRQLVCELLKIYGTDLASALEARW